jgi:hypothetical protein
MQTVNVPYTPNSLTAYNAKGGGISVVHTGTGAYLVICGGFPTTVGSEWFGDVQVTAVGDINTFCHVNNWSIGSVLAASAPANFGGIDRFIASVVCFGRGTGGGGGPAPADSEFNLLFVY